MDTTTQETFLDALRHHTKEAHENLERLDISKSILDPQVSKTAYATYLQRMAQVHESLERDIFPLLENQIPDLEERRKTVLLKRDLKALDATFPEAKNVFETQGLTTAQAMGVFYTVEGSTLGGRFILKNINQALGLDEHNGAAYFNGYGNSTGSRWKNFLNTLTSYAATSEQTANEIIAGAAYAFEAIAQHFQEN